MGDGELLPLAQKDAVADTECEFVTDAEKESVADADAETDGLRESVDDARIVE